MTKLSQYTIAGLAYLFRETKSRKEFSDIEQELIERDNKVAALVAALEAVQEWMHVTCPDDNQAPFSKQVKQALAQTKGEK